MKNVFYEKMINEDYKGNLTFKDFMEVCKKLELPVFEVKRTINPFAEVKQSTEPKVYKDISDFRQTMPDWSARNYDYINDRSTDYYNISEIRKGEFNISADNKSMVCEWHFDVLEGCVVVHTILEFMD